MNRDEIPGRIHLFVKSSNAKITYFLTGFYFCCIRKNLNFYSRVTQHPVISPCFHKDWKQEEINKIQYHLIVSSFLKNHMDKSHGHWCHEPLREISFVCVCVLLPNTAELYIVTQRWGTVHHIWKLTAGQWRALFFLTGSLYLMSLSYQDASISLLCLFIREQIEWKPQSQKTNQTDHIDHSLV